MYVAMAVWVAAKPVVPAAMGEKEVLVEDDASAADGQLSVAPVGRFVTVIWIYVLLVAPARGRMFAELN